MRHVILHNHLFKNAGTSVDHILIQNFGDRWLSEEFPIKGKTNTAELGNWIQDNPHACAFSTHTMLGPLPVIKDVGIIPVMLLRDPLDRIASAYRFERGQNAQSRGAQLAKTHGFAGYVHARLSTSGDRQCRNFQTHRLAMMLPDMAGTELERACKAAQMIHEVGVLGFVQRFDSAIERLSRLIAPYHPGFSWKPIVANASRPVSSNDISPAMKATLREANTDDLVILAHAAGLARHTATPARVPQVAGMA